MIKVTFTERDKILSLRIEGHAGYAEHSKDIVCASASILAYTWARFVTEAEGNDDLISPPTIRLDSGDTFISCEPFDHYYLVMLEVFSAIEMGYQLLAHNYPQYVRLIP